MGGVRFYRAVSFFSWLGCDVSSSKLWSLLEAESFSVRFSYSLSLGVYSLVFSAIDLCWCVMSMRGFFLTLGYGIGYFELCWIWCWGGEDWYGWTTLFRNQYDVAMIWCGVNCVDRTYLASVVTISSQSIFANHSPRGGVAITTFRGRGNIYSVENSLFQPRMLCRIALLLCPRFREQVNSPSSAMIECESIIESYI